jgi:hypothetical protein
MPYVSGPVEVLLVAGAAATALVIWLLRDKRYPGPRLHGDERGIDHDELEAAEREVQGLESGRQPEEGFEGDDWGPGAGGPRPPVRL